MMYAAIRGALAADDAAEKQGDEPRFRVRETPEWNLPCGFQPITCRRMPVKVLLINPR
jgi:hypothetical protein